MLKVVAAYKRLKTIENHKTVSPENWSRLQTGGGRLLEVPTVRLSPGIFKLVFWTGGRLRETVAHGGSTECHSIDRTFYEVKVKIY